MNRLQLICGNVFHALRLLPLVALLVSPTIARDVLHAVNPEGGTDLSFKDASGGLIDVTVTQSRLDGSYPYHDALLWGGDIGVLPKSIVIAIQIQKDKRSILVPISAYGDLGDVKSMSYSPMANGFRVSLHGGNTASSYDASLYFERGVLTRREVRLRELPNERWEKSSYTFPTRVR